MVVELCDGIVVGGVLLEFRKIEASHALAAIAEIVGSATEVEDGRADGQRFKLAIAKGASIWRDAELLEKADDDKRELVEGGVRGNPKCQQLAE